MRVIWRFKCEKTKRAILFEMFAENRNGECNFLMKICVHLFTDQLNNGSGKSAWPSNNHFNFLNYFQNMFYHWWLVRATYVVDGLFLGDFFWKVVGTVRIHVSHVQLPYTVINMWRINVWVEGAFMCSYHTQ